MAQNRSQQPHSTGSSGIAFQPGVVLRSGRAVRDQLGRAANDNRASLGHRLVSRAVTIASLALATALLWQWVA